MTAELYEFDKHKFLMEDFDGESVLVNVENGYYYSLSGSAPDILALLDSGMATEDIIATLLETNTSEEGRVRESVVAFADQLLKESILIPRKVTTSSAPSTRPVAPKQPSATFVAPELSKFEDMRDILLLDPIHQVDEAAGWPKPR